MQPDTKFLVTLSDPVKRMYSDYYFLDDSLRPVRPGQATTKSAAQFHERVLEQIEHFKKCVQQYTDDITDKNADIVSEVQGTAEGKASEFPIWFRASQM
jgi:hypothetical protein